MTTAQEALVALLAGITKYKEGAKEIWWKTNSNYPITIELTDTGWIERMYFYDIYPTKPDKTKTHREYNRQGLLHGRSIAWYRNGNKMYENLFNHGKLIGCKEWQQSGKRWRNERLD